MVPNPPLFGRFADPVGASPATDPRIDPRMLQAAVKLGVNLAMLAEPLSQEAASLMNLIKLVHDSEKAQEGIHDTIVDSERGSGVTHSLEHVQNPADGFEIGLHIHRPAEYGSEILPAVVIIHGGAMVMFDAYGPLYRRWAHDLARRGLVAVIVCYRNAVSDDLKHNPFPTGLNDCVVAMNWIKNNRPRLGVNKIIIQGESGGGNLAIATTMKLLRDGHRDIIDGLYAISPFVSGAYQRSEEWKVNHKLASLVECDGYLLNSTSMSIFAKVYDPAKDNEQNPLAWPWYGTQGDFVGFPPTVLTVDELDPLRDEGISVARKMAEAGVRISTRINLGMMHSAVLWQSLLAELNSAYLEDIKNFANSL